MGLLLCKGWKSNVSQREERAKFIKEKEGKDGVPRRFRKERKRSLIFIQGMGVFTEDYILWNMSPQASRNW